MRGLRAHIHFAHTHTYTLVHYARTDRYTFPSEYTAWTLFSLSECSVLIFCRKNVKSVQNELSNYFLVQISVYFQAPFPNFTPPLNFSKFMRQFQLFLPSLDREFNSVCHLLLNSLQSTGCHLLLSSLQSTIQWPSCLSVSPQGRAQQISIRLRNRETRVPSNPAIFSYNSDLQEAIEQRFEVDPSGLIMRLNHYSPWKDHLYNLEKELGVEKPILYCLVRRRLGEGSLYLPIKCVHFAWWKAFCVQHDEDVAGIGYSHWMPNCNWCRLKLRAGGNYCSALPVLLRNFASRYVPHQYEKPCLGVASLDPW